MLLSGAPEARSLDWNDNALLNAFDDPVARFLQLQSPAVNITPALSSALPPVWRSLSFERQVFSTGYSQNHALPEGHNEVSFFITSEVESQNLTGDALLPSIANANSESSQVLSQFYEHSYAVHEDVPSSQLAPSSVTGSWSSGNESIFTDASLGASGPAAQQVPVSGYISDLKNMPSAVYIRSIEPQTITVNLVIGIIAIPPPRRIRTQRGWDVNLMEVLVGDDTRSGFGVTFWLPLPAIAGDHRSILGALRPQDIVLMRNVALSSFRGKVHGQSLRKQTTKIHLLHRNRIDRTDVGGCFTATDLSSVDEANSLKEKSRRVREWVLNFVGVGIGREQSSRRRVVDSTREELPPDTQ